MSGSPHLVRPYGDTSDDGRVQLSFTLPLAIGPEALEAARQLALKMGIDKPSVVHSEALTAGGEGGGCGAYSFFVIYGECRHTIDMETIEVEAPEFEVLDKAAIDRLIADAMGRKLVILGACIETDAHTVGIDAIMNAKGFNGHKGLESYHEVRAINLGAQVDSQDLVRRLMDERADVLLVSQVVTQKDIHIKNLQRLRSELDRAGIGDEVVVVAGGPRITHELARELGFDAGFGPGSYAEDVASFCMQEWLRRHGHQKPSDCDISISKEG